MIQKLNIDKFYCIIVWLGDNVQLFISDYGLTLCGSSTVLAMMILVHAWYSENQRLEWECFAIVWKWTLIYCLIVYERIAHNTIKVISWLSVLTRQYAKVIEMEQNMSWCCFLEFQYPWYNDLYFYMLWQSYWINVLWIIVIYFFIILDKWIMMSFGCIVLTCLKCPVIHCTVCLLHLVIDCVS